MSVLATLLKKNLIESRWMLGLSTAAFFGLSMLTAWLAQRFEVLGSTTRTLRLYRGLGGEAMDYSTTALEVCWWNHPVIVLTFLSWAVTRGSAAVAGEIERGTIDLTLSRPVPRWVYLTSHVVFAALGLTAIAGALVAGSLAGNLVFTLKAPPTLLTLLKPATLVVTLGMAVYGYTLPFSTIDVVRWRATLAGAAITLAGLLSMTFAAQFENERVRNAMERVSVFRAYAPVTVAMRGDPLAYNATVLTIVAAIGLGLSYVLFSRRDIPSNS